MEQPQETPDTHAAISPADSPANARSDSPTEKSNAKINYWVGDMPRARYRVGRTAKVKAKGIDGKLRRVSAEITGGPYERNGKWAYLLKSPPAENREYLETEMD